ncbi:PAS domain S-box protein [Methanospirillum lacunae]|uniref:PAS domain S-box protein n=1 Tax=Methanospirillum lacunae TaxID=668570 RepID=UPI0015E843F4|nr:PAS domain S-box protein [Methanospirillum lacunae]
MSEINLSDMRTSLLNPVILSSIVIIIISVVTLIAYIFGRWKVISFGPDYVPMAPLTALLFFLFSIVLILQFSSLSKQTKFWASITGLSIIFGVSVISLSHGVFFFIPDINEILFHNTDMVAGFPVAKTSPVTAIIFILTSISLLTGLSSHRFILDISAVLAIPIAITGLIISFGYLYNTPFFYGGTEVPVAFATGLAFLFGGFALFYSRKEDTIFAEIFFGASIQSLLLRTFLPVILLFVLIEGLVFSILLTHSSINPVFLSGIVALGSTGVVTVIITLLSRQIGRIIEHAEKERDKSVLDLSNVNCELTKAYSDLKKNEEKLRILADYTYDLEIWEDPQGNYVYIGPSSIWLTGYSAEEFYQKKDFFSEIVHPEDRELWKEHLDNKYKSSSRLSIYVRIIHRNGSTKWIHHICQPIILSTGENLGWRSSNRDVTHEKIAEIALNERDAQYKLISENSADVIWIYSLAEQRLRFVSPSVFKMRGFTDKEVINQSFEEMLTEESYDFVNTTLPLRLSQFKSGDESARVWVTEIFQRCKDGSTVPTEAVTTLVADDYGNAVEIIGVSRDITERKEAEAKLNSALNQIDKNLETLAALNDQIRNPLTVMQFIAEEVGDKNGKILQDQIIHIDKLIDQLDKGYLYSEKVRIFLTKHANNVYNSNKEDESLVLQYKS